MPIQIYTGSCHCGAVRFTAEIDFDEGTHRCNCSFCWKTRAWFAFVPAHRMNVEAEDAVISEYQWTPQGKPRPFLRHQFCKQCGVRLFGRGELKELGGAFYAISVAALDDVNPEVLASAPIHYVDGRNDRFDQMPSDMRCL